MLPFNPQVIILQGTFTFFFYFMNPSWSKVECLVSPLATPGCNLSINGSHKCVHFIIQIIEGKVRSMFTFTYSYYALENYIIYHNIGNISSTILSFHVNVFSADWVILCIFETILYCCIFILIVGKFRLASANCSKATFAFISESIITIIMKVMFRTKLTEVLLKFKKNTLRRVNGLLVCYFYAELTRYVPPRSYTSSKPFWIIALY